MSWYEAAAYAEFAGKSLPTIYHWGGAAGPGATGSIVPMSNFAGKGTVRAGSLRGMSPSGAYDMAGNVKEWVWNEAQGEERYILGGAWDEPVYSFNDPDVQSPFERRATFGFRCARFAWTDAVAQASKLTPRALRDFSLEKPVSDELFRAYRSLYAYDKTPLHATVESIDDAPNWRAERVSFDAAYGKERVVAYLFLPKKSSPPFQAAVYFPGSGALNARSSKQLHDLAYFDFVVKSGRAVIYPVYKSTYERGDELTSDLPNTTNRWRDHLITWSKDLGRSIDYLETRPEINKSKIFYQGLSWGGAMGAILPAIEHRIKLCVLLSPGFTFQPALPEIPEQSGLRKMRNSNSAAGNQPVMVI